MTRFIQQVHQSIRKARILRTGLTKSSDSALPGEHKEYPRMPRIALPHPVPLTTRLDEVLAARMSAGECLIPRAFTDTELGTLFGHAVGVKTNRKPTRTYPSGGALYPIETYILGLVREGKVPGVFHYHPRDHALEHLWDLPDDFEMRRIIRTGMTPLSSTILIFTAVWDRSSARYGDFAYLLGLLETGHMAQNITLVGTALGIMTRPVGGFDDTYVIRLLGLDPRIEQPVYGVLLCTSPKSEDTPPLYE
ncbi:MAG: SagB/ThcOx family dehydrogenase [Patescibacteria group bacterium]